MNRRLTKVFGLMIVGCALLVATFGASRGKSAAPALFVPCPAHLIAPYGGADGWSTVNVQANFARAVMAPGKIMTCQYRFGRARYSSEFRSLVLPDQFASQSPKDFSSLRNDL